MIEPVSGWVIFGMVMQFFGDIFALLAVVMAGLFFLGEVVFKAPASKTTGPLTGSIALLMISTIGLIAKHNTNNDYPNGFIFGFNDFVIVLLLLLAFLLLIATVIIPRIR